MKKAREEIPRAMIAYFEILIFRHRPVHDRFLHPKQQRIDRLGDLRELRLNLVEIIKLPIACIVFALAIVFCCTIILIPVGIALFKIGVGLLMPCC